MANQCAVLRSHKVQVASVIQACSDRNPRQLVWLGGNETDLCLDSRPGPGSLLDGKVVYVAYVRAGSPVRQTIRCLPGEPPGSGLRRA